MIASLEDAKFSSQDIYMLYIDFTNAFGSIDHVQLLTIMFDLGYLDDVVSLVENIYSKSYSQYIGSKFEPTKSIPIQQGIIQGDTLNL